MKKILIIVFATLLGISAAYTRHYEWKKYSDEKIRVFKEVNIKAQKQQNQKLEKNQ